MGAPMGAPIVMTKTALIARLFLCFCRVMEVARTARFLSKYYLLVELF